MAFAKKQNTDVIVCYLCVFAGFISEIRVRVRAVYNDHSDALQTVQSMRQEPVERAFDKFSQTLGILQSRDLGSVVCETKFAELSYLDAFWKDYRNGTLLETLKGIFLKGKNLISVI